MKRYKKGQQVYSLNHGWRFVEKDISVLPPTKQHDDVYGFSKAGAYRGPADANYDDADWEIVNLPHDWVTKHDFVEEVLRTKDIKNVVSVGIACDLNYQKKIETSKFY